MAESENNVYWNPLVPELNVTDLEASLRFYVSQLGFTVRFQRDDPPFAYLHLGEAQIMLEQIHPEGWATAELARPFGRGINLQIEAPDVQTLSHTLTEQGVALFRPLAEKWYDVGGGQEEGQLEFLVQDPDGYLLRFLQPLGARSSCR